MTYVTFLFGPAMPILFPIGLLSLLSLYVTERLSMAYAYKRPPIQDQDVNNVVLRVLIFAPFLYILVAAWLYSNQQVFRDTVVFNETDDMFPKSDHQVYQFTEQITPGSVFLLALALLTLSVILSGHGFNLLGKCFGRDFDEQLRNCESSHACTDELPFLSKLSENKLRMWYFEETTLQSKYGIKRLNEAKIRHLFDLKMSQKEVPLTKSDLASSDQLHGCHSYDILQSKRN